MEERSQVLEKSCRTDGWRENMERVYEYVEEILGVDFDGLYAYFSKILEGGFRYIVLMSRRCQVLYRLFKLIFEYDKKIINTKAIILSDKALPFYWDKIENGDRIAVIDDILVHGRTISEIYEIIKNSDKKTEIRLFCYQADQNMDCLSEEAARNLSVSYPAGTKEWRELSDKLVNCIQISNMPYTSFVTSFFQYKEPAFLTAIQNIQGLQIMEVTNAVQLGQKQHSYIIFDPDWEKPAVFSSLSLGECIRIYWNEITEKLTVIPYVFIRSLPGETASKVYQSVGKALPEEFRGIKEIFEKAFALEKIESSLKEYKMLVLTCILSNYYWDDFCCKYSLTKPEYTDVDTLQESFGDTIGEELYALKRDKINKLSGLAVECSTGLFESISDGYACVCRALKLLSY